MKLLKGQCAGDGSGFFPDLIFFNRIFWRCGSEGERIFFKFSNFPYLLFEDSLITVYEHRYCTVWSTYLQYEAIGKGKGLKLLPGLP